jgi:hypothetical protein
MKRWIAAALITVTTPAFAADPPKAPPAPPEVQKTVDAFKGHWKVDATLTLPDGTQAKGTAKIDCDKTALGSALACHFNGAFPQLGPHEESDLVAYDRGGKHVHFMAVSSDGEVHDHVCDWQGDVLDCGTLSAFSGDQPVKETLRFDFGGGKLTLSSTSAFPDGSKVSLVVNGKR